MLPVIAIVGRPNVGKSTLFNRLTRSRDALVHDEPGVTRDRQYGQGKINDKPFIIVDTGGIGEHDDLGIDKLMAQQAHFAMQEADVILFMVDAKAGVTGADEVIANHLRTIKKPIYLLTNKVDGTDSDIATADFYRLSMGEPYPIAAVQGRGVNTVMSVVLATLPTAIDTTIDDTIKIAIVGRPNVGKSTLVNRLLGEERVITFDEPGTTRDSISIHLEHRGKHYTLIDTAGLRRRGKVSETIEKFSCIKALQAVNAANVVIMIIDARREIAQQDLFLLSYIIDSGRALVLAINKWDGLPQENKHKIREDVERKIAFTDFAKTHFISALHGTGVGDLFRSIDVAYASATTTYSPSRLTGLLEDALKAHQPPMVRSRRVKLRYAHMGGQNPPIIVIHGNQEDELPESYVRYLTNHFRKALRIKGTPIRLQFKKGENPYKDKKNTLNLSQQRKKKRLMTFVKKSQKKPKRR